MSGWVGLRVGLDAVEDRGILLIGEKVKLK
jgi:hypothetical protein